MDIGEDYSHLYAGETRKKNRKKYTDGLVAVRTNTDRFDVAHAIAQDRHNNTSAVLLKGERTHFFYTEDSHTYISPYQQTQSDARWNHVDARSRFDSVHVRYIKQYTVGERHYHAMTIQTDQIFDTVSQYRAALRITMTPMRMYRLSLTGAMIFGMVSMSLIYRNLGQNAFAQEDEKAIARADDTEVVRVIENSAKEEKEAEVKKEKEENSNEKAEKIVREEKLTVEKEEKEEEQNVTKEPVVVADVVPVQKNVIDAVEASIEKEIVQKEVKNIDSASQKKVDEEDVVSGQIAEVEKSFEEIAYETVKDHPIEKMLPYILEQDPEVAKYLIAIAKQESNWGKRVPVLNGQDCYNYWGYRGIRKLMGTGGHTCFNSRKDAVETVGKRINDLIYEYDRKTANRLIVWKCGSTCDGHSQESVNRWINVVDTYYDRLSMSR
jgi:hypothetical protein